MPYFLLLQCTKFNFAGGAHSALRPLLWEGEGKAQKEWKSEGVSERGRDIHGRARGGRVEAWKGRKPEN